MEIRSRMATAITAAVVLALGAASVNVASAEEEGGWVTCFICDDWINPGDNFYYHSDVPLFFNDMKGKRHQAVWGVCEMHQGYLE